MTQCTSPSRIYDQVLLAFEMGHIQQATLLLAGTLDGVVAQGGDIARWHDQLRSHALGEFIAPAQDDGAGTSHVVHLSAIHGAQRILADTLSTLGANRALSARLALTRVAVDHARAQRQRVFDYAANCDPQGQYDLLVAVELADELRPEQLGTRLRQLQQWLAQDGMILISSLAPGHFGQGWHAVCAGRRRQCHDEEQLGAAALCAGLTLTHFRDASDCLVWGVLTRAGAGDAAGDGENKGKSHD